MDKQCQWKPSRNQQAMSDPCWTRKNSKWIFRKAILFSIRTVTEHYNSVSKERFCQKKPKKQIRNTLFIQSITLSHTICLQNKTESLNKHMYLWQLIFSIDVKTVQMGKNSVFNKCCWNNRIVTYKRMKVNSYFTLY